MRLEKQLQFIKPLEWEEVLGIWRNNEENEKHWKIYYQTKGFNSWEGWREKYIEPTKTMNKKWGLYKIIDPVAMIPTFRGGMYKGWLPFYNGRRFPTFHEIIRHPDIDKHKGIPQFMDNFAPKITVIAWLTKRGVIIIEGMHRCAAAALAEKLGKKIETEMYIALAEVDEKDIPDFTKDRAPTNGLVVK